MKSISYGGKSICYSLKRSNRKTLAITVEPDMRVLVTAPQLATEEDIERVLRKRALWILRQQRFFAQFLPRTPERQYISGETHLYLGRQYRLRVRQADTPQVKLIGGYIYVFTPDAFSPETIKALLYGWYSAHAQDRFRERLQVCMQKVAGWNIPTPELSIRPMASCWGRCSSSGKLTLNLDIIRAPRACIDYVILHEICHLRHHNHTREFYKLLALLIPDWRETKLRLEHLLS